VRSSPGPRGVLLAIGVTALFCIPAAAAAWFTTRLHATAVSRFDVDLRWTPGGASEVAVAVERRVSGSSFQPVVVLPGGETTWHDTGLAPATRYDYRVRSIDASGPLTWSNIASANTFINHLPVVTTSLTGVDELRDTTTQRVTIRVDDLDGDDVTLRLADPPPGFVMEPMEHVPAGTTRVARWWLPAIDGGLRWLHFKAFDSAEPNRVVDHRERVMVSGWYGGSLFSRQQSASGDVDGDGKTDLVVVAPYATIGGVAGAGAVYVWSDVAHGGGSLTATLAVPGAATNDYLSSSQLVLTDVTGDGVQDVVVSSAFVDLGTAQDAGAIHLFAGGSGLAGSVSPTATLTRPGALSFDKLGSSLIRFVDLDADGVDDLVVPVPDADLPLRDAGLILYWRGGATLVGAPPPDATLSLAAPVKSGNFGRLRCADVTGDRIPDVVENGPSSVSLFVGGPGFSGARTPDAQLQDPTGIAASLVDLADLDGDGTLDVLASSARASVNGAANAGVLLIWKGDASLTGVPAPTAEITAANPQADEYFPGTVLLTDVTGDGQRDVVGCTSLTDVNGIADVGAVHVVASSGGFSGTISATATFVPSSGSAGDLIGSENFFHVHDVTGDGIDDVIAGSPVLDRPGAVDAGGGYVWAGSTTLSGTVTESSHLFVDHPVAGDRLTDLLNNGPGVQFGDVSGDGIDDIVMFSSDRTDLGHFGAGAVLVWKGGASKTGAPKPLAKLRVKKPQDSDHQGSALGGAMLFDWNGDGVLDVLAGSPDMGSVKWQGSIQLWFGGAQVTGIVDPNATLEAKSATQSDNLGAGSGWLIETVDVDADGRVDVVAVATHADDGSKVDVGKAYYWRSDPNSGPGILAPTAVFGRANVAAWDSLGFVGQYGQPLRLIDADDDGKLDLFLGGRWLDVGGVADAGAVEYWSGTNLVGVPVPFELSVPTAQPGDSLGGY
jgi:FG-GAP repeat protein/VCBS repeat protein